MTDEYPHAAAGFLYDADKKSLLLHHRDGYTVHDPHHWAFFTGRSREGEAPVDGFVRVMKEGTGVTLSPSDVVPLCEYLNEELLTYRHVFYVERYIPIEEMILGEGAGFAWVPLAQVFALDLTEKTRRDIKFFLEKLNS